MTQQVQSFAIAAGLVVVGLLGLVILWKVTKSLFTLAFWFAAAAAIAVAGWWLLAKEGILPPLPAF
jgi:hypothetical protein